MADPTREGPKLRSTQTSTKAQVSFLACARCRARLPSGHSEPLCTTCSHPPPQPVPAPTDNSGSSAPIPEPPWARELALSMSSLQGLARLPDTLDKFLTQLTSQPPTLGVLGKRKTPGIPALLHSDEESEPAEEGQITEDSSEEEPPQEIEVAPSDMDSLVEAVLSALQVSPPTASDPSTDLFKRQKKTSRVFPSHDQLFSVVKEEWAAPERKTNTSRRFNLLYPFTKEDIDLWSLAPTVDPPISRLAKSTTIPVPDGAGFKDPIDKRLEGFCKSIFCAAGSALRPTFASAWVSRASEVWADQLCQAVLEGSDQASILQLAEQIKEASQFVCQASLDSAKMIARASATSIAARRFLWLKHWSADLTSKKSLVSIPFSGKVLFGTELEKIISQATGGKSTLLPQNKPKTQPHQRRFSRFRSLRSKQTKQPPSDKGSSFRSRGKRPAWSSGRQPQK
uniref:Ig-like domain-containing protein n=1 Tax=Xenopus tropicalis TaxID=8364 RepID=A0A6I8R3T5_XENTR